MSQTTKDLRSDLISFLNETGHKAKNSAILFVEKEKIDNSQSVAELLDLIEELENENEENINKFLSMSDNFQSGFIDPFQEISSIKPEFDQNMTNFKANKEQFDESFDKISRNIMPLVIKNQNFDIAISLYSKLKNGIEEIEEFKKSFRTNIQQAVERHLNKILEYNIYFKQTTNSDANEIFNNILQQLEYEVSTQITDLDKWDTFIIFFDKFDENENENSIKIKEEVLYQIYKDQIKTVLNNINKPKAFIENFLNVYDQALESPTKRFTNQVPSSFSKGLIKIFENRFLQFTHVVDHEIRSRGIKFSYKAFYEHIHSLLTNQENKFSLNHPAEAASILKLATEKYTNELLNNWSNNISKFLDEKFPKYIQSPKSIFETTEKFAKIEPSSEKQNLLDENDTYFIYEHKYLIPEVYHVIRKFDIDYSNLLIPIGEVKNPKFVELLINTANKIVDSLNQIKIPNRAKKMTSLIIYNSYAALDTIVGKYKRYKYNSPKELNNLNGLKSYHDSFLVHFITLETISSERVKKFFQMVDKFVVEDSYKIKLANIFIQRIIILFTKKEASTPNSVNIETLNSIFDQILSILSIEGGPYQNDKMNKTKIFINRTKAFFCAPREGTLSELMCSLKGHFPKKFETNLRLISKRH